jgi:hypothetical protein
MDADQVLVQPSAHVRKAYGRLRRPPRGRTYMTRRATTMTAAAIATIATVETARTTRPF